MLSPWERKTLALAAVIVTVVLVAVAFSGRADAARPSAAVAGQSIPASVGGYHRVGLDGVRVVFLGTWTVRLFVVEHRGPYGARGSAAVAGYNSRGRRLMRFKLRVVCGDTDVLTRSVKTFRLVARTGRAGWTCGGPVRALATVKLPNGDVHTIRWRSDP